MSLLTTKQKGRSGDPFKRADTKSRADQMKIVKVIRYLFGAIYALAGVAKAFPQIEDVGQVLQKAAAANQDTLLAGLSLWLAEHAQLMAWVSGIALFSSGLCYLFNRLLQQAVIGQCLMLVGFITLLHRAFPQIILIDLIFLVVALIVFWESAKARRRTSGNARQF
jgi:spermidine dehydrogenase